MSTHDLDINELLPDDAVAIQAVRIVDGKMRTYTPLTGAKNGRSFCYTWLNRCRAFGMIAEDDEYALIDVLNDNGDIVAEVPLTRDGFRYLAKKLKWRWENRSECEALEGESIEITEQARRTWTLNGRTCTWTQDPDGYWYTECGNAYEFMEDGPEENNHKFCPYCGGHLAALLTRPNG